MKEQTLNIRYMVAQLSELSQQEQELVNKAKAATNNAYANYSHFYVGAALLLGDGRIVIGANQENAAFPSGLCAERHYDRERVYNTDIKKVISWYNSLIDAGYTEFYKPENKEEEPKEEK